MNTRRKKVGGATVHAEPLVEIDGDLDDALDVKVETIWSTLKQASSSMDLAPEILSYIESEVRAALTGCVFTLQSAGNVWEAKGAGPAASTDDYEFRKIMAMGGEKVVFDGWRLGKKRGMLLQFKAISEFPGVKVEGFLEWNLRDILKSKPLKDLDSGRYLGEMLEALPCMQPTPVELSLNLEQIKKLAAERIAEADRQRQVQQHGDEWGAW